MIQLIINCFIFELQYLKIFTLIITKKIDFFVKDSLQSYSDSKKQGCFLMKTKSQYSDWNNQIAKYFFNSSKARMRVWFSVEQEIINKIAKAKNVDPNDFIKAVKKGPDCIHRPKQTICSRASAIFQEWRKNKENFEYPPYIAYLALFVLAVNHGDSDNFSEGDYYGRLRDMIGGTHLSTNHFKNTIDLWDDLENWSQEDKSGNFGEFHNDTFGKNFYIGIPSYQVVLRTDDKNGLFKIFQKMGWDSESNPTEEEILRALKNNEKLLSSKTAKRIKKGKTDFLSILPDRVLEELREYDDEKQTDDQNQTNYKRGFIEICLSIDETAQEAKFYFRCKRKSGLPEEKFILESNGLKWETIASLPHISQKIENFNIIDSLEEDFCMKSGKYKFYYRGSKYKVFTENKLGARDWISGQRYSLNKLFYLLVHNSLFDKVQKWGELECDEFHKMDFDGLPEKWHLVQIKGVKGDKWIKKDIPALSIDKKLRIKFEDGIRISKGSKFFNFAPPKVIVTGGAKQISALEYSIGDHQSAPLILSQKEENVFCLPKDAPCGEKITIKVSKDEIEGGELDSSLKSLMLVETRLKRIPFYLDTYVDCFGNFTQLKQKDPDESNASEALYFKGAYCYGLKNGNYPRLTNNKRRVYILGNVPGEIINYPQEAWPKWKPVWMLEFKTWKKVTAYLIGEIKQKDLLNNKEQNFSKEKIKMWKKISWNNRKQIKLNSKEQKKQWKNWVEEARNV